MKNKNNHLYVKIVLILSDDISLITGSVTRYQRKDHKLEVCKSKGLYFIHLDIYSVLLKQMQNVLNF